MKLSKQERIGALIILAVVILALGAFLLVKPKIETIGSTKNSLEQKQAEYDAAVEKRKKKAPLRDEIIQAYQDGEHMADMFFPELSAYESDAAFREFISQCKANVVVEEFQVQDPGTETLDSVFYTPVSVEYALKTYANQGVEPSEEEAKLAARKVALQTALGVPQTIGASIINFTVSANDREELIKFADEVNDYIRDENGTATRKAIQLNGIGFEYVEINDKYDDLSDANGIEMEKAGRIALRNKTNRLVRDPENETEPEEEAEANVDEYIFTWTDTITFYSIERMQDPTAQLNAQDGIE